MTVDEKHYLPNKGDLMQTIQIQLSQKKKKNFWEFFFHFENLYQNFNISQKMVTFVADLFLEILAPKNMVRQMYKKPCFRGPLDGQQGKWVETLLRSE